MTSAEGVFEIVICTGCLQRVWLEGCEHGEVVPLNADGSRHWRDCPSLPTSDARLAHYPVSVTVTVS